MEIEWNNKLNRNQTETRDSLFAFVLIHLLTDARFDEVDSLVHKSMDDLYSSYFYIFPLVPYIMPVKLRNFAE